MKIYILTYSRKTFFSREKRVSGIDVAALTQFNILKEMGHDVRMFSAFTDLDQDFSGIDYYVNHNVKDIKSFSRTHKSSIEKKIINDIHKFKPDVIISNYEFSKFYKELLNLNIPIVYVLHSMPGFWTDFLNANLLNEMVSTHGCTFCAVSEYHKAGIIKYYSTKRSEWNFDGIVPDEIFYPQYCEKTTVQESDGFIRHVSAASKGKDTFLINIYLEGSGRNVKTYSTLGHQSKDQQDEYVLNALNKYSKDIELDVNHSEIMDNIGKSEVTFVGNYPDTFTITSLESLSRGVPLILKDKNGHPALEMLPKEYHKYLKLIKTKSDFLNAVSVFKNMTLSERQELANAAETQMGKEKYKSRISTILNNAITKFNNRSKIQSLDW